MPRDNIVEVPAASGAAPEGTAAILRGASTVLGSHVAAALLGIASLPVLAQTLGPGPYGRFSLFLTLLGVVTYQDFLRPLLVRVFSARSGDEAALRGLSSCVAWLLASVALAAGLALFTPGVALLFAVAVLAHGLASVDFARLARAGRVARAALVRNFAWGAAAVSAAGLAWQGGAETSLFVCALPFCVANVTILLIYRRAVSATSGGDVRATSASDATTALWPSAVALRGARAAWSTHRSEIAALIGFGLANALVVSADRFVALRWLEPQEFGLYAACADLASKLAIVGTAAGTVLYPSFARHAGGAHEAQRFVGLATRIMIGWGVVIALLVFSAGPLVELVLGPQYAAGRGLCALLFAASFVHMLGFLLTPWQRARGEFAPQTRAYAAAGVCMVAVGAILVPAIGLVGAVACACTARIAEVALLAREVRFLPAAALPRARLAALGSMAAGILALALWRFGEAA